MEDKSNFENYKSTADEYFRNNKFEDAIKNYTLAIETDVESDNYKVYMNRCLSYFKLDKFDEALDDAIKATRLNNESSKAWSRVGSCLVALDKYNQAVKAFEKACELEPTNEFYKNLLENAKDKKNQENVDTDTEDEDDVNVSSKNIDKDELKEKIEELKKSNNLPDLLTDKNGIPNSLVDGLFDSMLSNDKLMNKLSDKDFQDKVVDYQKNPFAIFKDKEMMDLMNDIITKTKFGQ